MAADRVRASITFVRNIGNFESVRIELGVERDVPEDKNPYEAASALYEKVEKLVEEKILEINEEAGLVSVTKVQR